ncbi:cysteine three histidine 1 [Corythoichthys intestinalis]|uniref:cysteine three histidine 1 n=1 Tax=Corythoichthys intestinalis TaxID=161448 RepID=UPI0025A682B9|nr:cysteine three histidine 1 [Corythoichthys intestinalis]
MIKASGESLSLPSWNDQELVDDLLSGDGPGRGGAGFSLVKALLPVSDPPFGTIQWACSTRYKTELCMSYASTGSCRYAERCTFAHGLCDLHVPFRHPKYKTKPCRSYHGLGRCHYGSRCCFVHGAAERRPAQRDDFRHANVPCRTFSKFGICPYGAHCHFLHVEGAPKEAGKPQSALCYTFSSFGFCPYGTWCRFRHVLPDAVKSTSPSLGSEGPASPMLDSQSASPSASPKASCATAFSSSIFQRRMRRMESEEACDMWELL